MNQPANQTKPAFVEIAQQLGITLASEDLARVVQAIQNAYSTGLKDGATFERRKHLADIEAWKADAATAEKWRGMALAKDPMQPGKAVQEIQREAAKNEREACAVLAEDRFFGNPGELNHEIAEAIRARGEA